MSLKRYLRDEITAIGDAVIQHGPLSRRIYLMKLGKADPEYLIPVLETIAQSRNYTKIFAKVPQSAVAPFLQASYHIEARVPGFYGNDESACFLGHYLSAERQVVKDSFALEDVMWIARNKVSHQIKKHSQLPEGFTARRCSPADTETMAELYSQVFSTYPFPIDDPDYLRETMQSHIQYYGVEHGGRLVALSSAETDMAERNAEMTDFATLPSYRNRGLALNLLSYMEAAMRKNGIKTAYTIARAVSIGMNITFAQNGYSLCGTLINNTNISGTIESMNVWFKSLDPDLSTSDECGFD